jgi:hypothetical protein
MLFCPKSGFLLLSYRSGKPFEENQDYGFTIVCVGGGGGEGDQLHRNAFRRMNEKIRSRRDQFLPICFDANGDMRVLFMPVKRRKYL